MWSSVLTEHVRVGSPELSNIESTAPSTFDLSHPNNSSSNIAFISLHAGAGFLHPSQHVDMQALLQSAINSALQHRGTAEDAVAIALSVLESSPLTNSALGSCLTEDGRVECEASVVMGTGAMGSVSAACGIDHPIQVAHRLAKDRNDHGLIKEMGRVRPISLAGEGAYRYAQQCGLGVAAQDQIDQHNITSQTRSIWSHYQSMIEHNRHQRQPHGSHKRSAAATDTSRPSEWVEPQGASPASTPDTIGAIVCDYAGRVYAGTSSGGIWMKSAGRVGSSAIPGAGCYAVNGERSPESEQAQQRTRSQASVAAAVSGCGEDIMEQFTAVRCCDMMGDSDIDAASTRLASPTSSLSPMQRILRRLMVKEQILSQTITPGNKRKHNSSGSQDTLVEDGGLSTGIIALKAMHSADGRTLELHHTWAHTARHFALGFAVGDAAGRTYESQAWVSVRSEQAGDARMMKAGEVVRVLHPSSSSDYSASSNDASGNTISNHAVR